MGERLKRSRPQEGDGSEAVVACVPLVPLLRPPIVVHKAIHASTFRLKQQERRRRGRGRGGYGERRGWRHEDGVRRG